MAPTSSVPRLPGGANGTTSARLTAISTSRLTPNDSRSPKAYRARYTTLISTIQASSEAPNERASARRSRSAESPSRARARKPATVPRSSLVWEPASVGRPGRGCSTKTIVAATANTASASQIPECSHSGRSRISGRAARPTNRPTAFTIWSSTIEPSTVARGSPVRRDSHSARASSPARAGTTVDTAKPISSALNACAWVTSGASGWSSARQRAAIA